MRVRVPADRAVSYVLRLSNDIRAGNICRRSIEIPPLFSAIRRCRYRWIFARLLIKVLWLWRRSGSTPWHTEATTSEGSASCVRVRPLSIVAGRSLTRCLRAIVSLVTASTCIHRHPWSGVKLITIAAIGESVQAASKPITTAAIPLRSVVTISLRSVVVETTTIMLLPVALVTAASRTIVVLPVVLVTAASRTIVIRPVVKLFLFIVPSVATVPDLAVTMATTVVPAVTTATPSTTTWREAILVVMVTVSASSRVDEIAKFVATVTIAPAIGET